MWRTVKGIGVGLLGIGGLVKASTRIYDGLIVSGIESMEWHKFESDIHLTGEGALSAWIAIFGMSVLFLVWSIALLRDGLGESS